MTKNKTYILLDRSGSMADNNRFSEALSGLNSYVNSLKVDSEIMVSVFDTEYNVIRNTNTKAWEPVTQEEVSPQGGTALIDSAVRLFHHAVDENPARAVLIVITDGFENASVHFKKEYLSKLTKQIEDKKYELMFFGADFSQVGESVSRTFNFNDGTKIAPVAASSMGLGLRSTAAKAGEYYTSGSSIRFTDEEKEKLVK